MPSAISLSYFSETAAVISVLIIPGRISKTGISYSASLSANKAVTMETPAFDMQYSPRETDETYADIEPMLTMRGQCEESLFLDFLSSIISFATLWVKKNTDLRLVSRTKSKLSSVVSRMSLRTGGAIPALFTSRSMPPNALITSIK